MGKVGMNSKVLLGIAASVAVTIFTIIVADDLPLSDVYVSNSKKSILDSYANLPEVRAFYAKYPDVREEVKSDHVSYFAGSDDGFKIRMNLYFDENYDLDSINLKCYLNRELQTDVPESFILKYLKDFTCDEHGSQRNEN